MKKCKPTILDELLKHIDKYIAQEESKTIFKYCDSKS